MKGKRPLLVLLIVIAIVLLYPVEMSIVPTWTIRVVNNEGEPVKRKFVRQGWGHYSLEFYGDHTEDGWTDDEGYVTFPERTIRASLLRRTLAPVLNTILLREHASFGMSAQVIVWGNNRMSRSVNYEPGKPLPTEIVVP